MNLFIEFSNFLEALWLLIAYNLIDFIGKVVIKIPFHKSRSRRNMWVIYFVVITKMRINPEGPYIIEKYFGK